MGKKIHQTGPKCYKRPDVALTVEICKNIFKANSVAPILNFFADTDSQFYRMISASTDSLIFLSKKTLGKTRNPLILYIVVILEVKIDNRAQNII